MIPETDQKTQALTIPLFLSFSINVKFELIVRNIVLLQIYLMYTNIIIKIKISSNRMSFKRKGSTRRVYVPNKMDQTRAQGILGFTSNRWMDTTNDADPKEALDKALAAQMQKVSAKKGAPKEKVQIQVQTIES